jgi:outer membrane protein assembly factor BamD
MKKPVFALALSLVAFTVPMQLDAATVFTSRDGWKVEGDPAVEGEAVELMRQAEQQEAQSDLSGALSSYRALVKRHPVSVLAGRAQYRVGSILEAAGEFDDAYKAYDVYLTKYPKGDEFDAAVESMFKIAKLYLEGEKQKVFGIKIASSMKRAQEMFEGIVKRAPFSRFAPPAQFNVGQALEKQGSYDGALAAYAVLVTKYPNDAIADDAQYQIGYVRLKQYREGSYDQASAAKAREAFEDFINRYPESEKVPQARENMKLLEGGANKSTLDVAKFYDKTKRYRAAVIYYNDVIKNSPDTGEASFAKARIEELRQKHGEDALKAGPERAETGQKAAARRRLQAKVDTVSRPDYVGPVVVMPKPDEVAPGRPRLRTSPLGPVPAVEPELPLGDSPGAEALSQPKPAPGGAEPLEPAAPEAPKKNP